VSDVASTNAASWPGRLARRGMVGGPLRRSASRQRSPPSLLAPSRGTSDKELLCRGTRPASSRALTGGGLHSGAGRR